MTILDAAFHGSLMADALAMPVHWYYDREALDEDYPDLDHYQPPLPRHPGSILWRSNYVPVNADADILHDQARFWGQAEVHYHQNLPAGENTVNFQLARALHEQVCAAGHYDPTDWAELYVKLMRTPGWHRDTYLEEYHRAFFDRRARGKSLLKCGIADKHIGGLATVPALVAALSDRPLKELRQTIKTHVTLTHRESNVLRAADCLTRLLSLISKGLPLREALMQGAGDWFSTRKANAWSRHDDRVIIGQKLSPACYIDQSFPASLYLAWKYHHHFREAVTANARVGGDNCHRGAVVGSLTAAEEQRLKGGFDPALFRHP